MFIRKGELGVEVGYGGSGKQLFQGVEAWLLLGVWKALDSSWERHKNECEAKAGKVVKKNLLAKS